MFKSKNVTFFTRGFFCAQRVKNFIIIVPDRRSQVLEVVIVRRLATWVLGIWGGGGLGEG